MHNRQLFFEEDKVDNIQKFYDLIAEQEAEDWYPNEMLLPVIRRFIALLPAKPRVLDLGCGTGHESMRLKNQGADVVGVDYSANSIEIAKARNPDIAFYEMDFTYPLDNLGSFDGIFSSASFVHMKDSQIDTVLAHLKTMHTTGGIFLALFQKGEGQRIHYPEINGVTIERIIERHTKESMKTLFAGHGYAFIEEVPVPEDPRAIWMCLLFRKNG